jgi:hypothetical protein
MSRLGYRPIMVREDPANAGCWETYLKILKISSISESPGNKGCFIAISAKIHPTLHISIAVE